ncbi:exported hypothetical protein [Candidatus Sulfopaludibacter sp. SbA4]|nr:exported hypothetical protein [Candidatus Sulfopaludibacter sp. SbA4]
MKRTVLRNKWFAGAVSAAAMAGLWFGAALFRPSAAKAFTLTAMPAWVFPEVTAQTGENLMLCTNNLTGDGTTQAIIAVLDVADSAHYLANTTPLSMPIGPQKGQCSLLLPAVRTEGARTGIPVIFVMPGANIAGFGGGAGRGLVSSLQLVGADGSVKLVTTPTYMDGLLVVIADARQLSTEHLGISASARSLRFSSSRG